MKIFTTEQRLIRAVRNADMAHEKSGGGANHYVRECLLPSLADEGLVIVDAPAAETKPRNECTCGASFTTPQGLGLHFKAGICKEPGPVEGTCGGCGAVGGNSDCTRCGGAR